MKKIMDREILLKGVLQQTERFKIQYYPKVKALKGFSVQDTKMVGLIDALSGCNNSKVRELVELIIGKPLPPSVKPSSTSVVFSPLVAFVPLSNPNGHNYPIDQVSVITATSSGAIKQDGSIGNTMTTSINCLRPATEKEITKFISKLPDEAVSRLLNSTCIVRI